MGQEWGEGPRAQPRKEGRSRWEPAHLSRPKLTIASLSSSLGRSGEKGSHSPCPPGAQRDTDDGQVGGGAALTWGRACTTVSAFPWPSSGASALWATPNPAHSAQTSRDRPVCVCACECGRARKWRSVNETPHYNPLGTDEWGWCTKTRPPWGGCLCKKAQEKEDRHKGADGYQVCAWARNSP